MNIHKKTVVHEPAGSSGREPERVGERVDGRARLGVCVCCVCTHARARARALGRWAARGTRPRPGGSAHCTAGYGCGSSCLRVCTQCLGQALGGDGGVRVMPLRFRCCLCLPSHSPKVQISSSKLPSRAFKTMRRANHPSDNVSACRRSSLRCPPGAGCSLYLHPDPSQNTARVCRLMRRGVNPAEII